jgi:hypothetical protein
LQDTIERIFAQDLYADIKRGLFLVRGENVLLLGEIVRFNFFYYTANDLVTRNRTSTGTNPFPNLTRRLHPRKYMPCKRKKQRSERSARSLDQSCCGHMDSKENTEGS